MDKIIVKDYKQKYKIIVWLEIILRQENIV
jgi:hypothetical protein